MTDTANRTARADTEIRPFRIEIPQADLDDLRDRLHRTRWPDELPGAGWTRGVPLGYLKQLADLLGRRLRLAHARSAAERVPAVHHQRSTGRRSTSCTCAPRKPDAMPLLLIHGWPGSIVEFLDVIGPLTDPRGHGGDPSDAFHLVIPSIPGHGFSGAAQRAGVDTRSHRQGVHRADGPARLRAVRRPGWRRRLDPSSPARPPRPRPGSPQCT